MQKDKHQVEQSRAPPSQPYAVLAARGRRQRRTKAATATSLHRLKAKCLSPPPLPPSLPASADPQFVGQHFFYGTINSCFDTEEEDNATKIE
jgi:hypothetical protein